MRLAVSKSAPHRVKVEPRSPVSSASRPASGGPASAATPCSAVSRPKAGGRRGRPSVATRRGEVAATQAPVSRPASSVKHHLQV